MLYVISLNNHEIQARIGLHPQERCAPQKVLITISLLLEKTNHQDDLVGVVDYDFLRTIIRERIEIGHINLQETLCQDLLDTCRCVAGVKGVRISSAKPDVYPDTQSVGCHMTYIAPEIDHTQLKGVWDV